MREPQSLSLTHVFQTELSCLDVSISEAHRCPSNAMYSLQPHQVLPAQMLGLSRALDSQMLDVR